MCSTFTDGRKVQPSVSALCFCFALSSFLILPSVAARYSRSCAGPSGSGLLPQGLRAARLAPWSATENQRRCRVLAQRARHPSSFTVSEGDNGGSRKTLASDGEFCAAEVALVWDVFLSLSGGQERAGTWSGTLNYPPNTRPKYTSDHTPVLCSQARSAWELRETKEVADLRRRQSCGSHSLCRDWRQGREPPLY